VPPRLNHVQWQLSLFKRTKQGESLHSQCAHDQGHIPRGGKLEEGRWLRQQMGRFRHAPSRHRRSLILFALQEVLAHLSQHGAGAFPGWAQQSIGAARQVQRWVKAVPGQDKPTVVVLRRAPPAHRRFTVLALC